MRSKERFWHDDLSCTRKVDAGGCCPYRMWENNKQMSPLQPLLDVLLLTSSFSTRMHQILFLILDTDLAFSWQCCDRSVPLIAALVSAR